jgi:hypothetical protein
MNRTRTAVLTALGLALSAPAVAGAHEPTPADYERAAEACAPYYAPDSTEQGCPGPVIQAALHPETWCTPTTVPACTAGPTADAPLASTGPVPPAPGPSPSWEEQIARNYPSGPARELAGLPPAPVTHDDPMVTTAAPVLVGEVNADVVGPVVDEGVAVPTTPTVALSSAPVLALPDAVLTAIAVADVMRTVVA